MYPIVPLVCVLSATPLGITMSGFCFCPVVPKWIIAVLGGMADINTMSATVIFDLSPLLLLVLTATRPGRLIDLLT